jgi:uncharacterized membrane protein YphA (DoxX/SURF4 family)
VYVRQRTDAVLDECDQKSREAMPNPSEKAAGNGLRVSLWIVQGLLSLIFVGTGLWKLFTPIPELAAMIPWAGQVSPGLLYATAVFDLLGGFGILLPSLTRIKPGLTVLAALGCAALQASAIVFHLSRGEGANTPFNFLLVALSFFVAWGRRSRAPIAPRAGIER